MLTGDFELPSNATGRHDPTINTLVTKNNEANASSRNQLLTVLFPKTLTHGFIRIGPWEWPHDQRILYVTRSGAIHLFDRSRDDGVTNTQADTCCNTVALLHQRTAQVTQKFLCGLFRPSTILFGAA